MGWHGIDPSAIARCKLLSLRMGWTNPLFALGPMGGIWGESQELEIDTASREELLLWSQVSAAESQRFITLLEDAKIHFISPLPDGRFKIHGNAERIARIREQRAANRENAKKRWHPKAEVPVPTESECEPHSDSDATRIPNGNAKAHAIAMPTGTGTITNTDLASNPLPPSKGGEGRLKPPSGRELDRRAKAAATRALDDVLQVAAEPGEDDPRSCLQPETRPLFDARFPRGWKQFEKEMRRAMSEGSSEPWSHRLRDSFQATARRSDQTG